MNSSDTQARPSLGGAPTQFTPSVTDSLRRLDRAVESTWDLQAEVAHLAELVGEEPESEVAGSSPTEMPTPTTVRERVDAAATRIENVNARLQATAARLNHNLQQLTSDIERNR